MATIGSWRFWVIVALALATMACAGRRERREQAREDRRERAEQRRAERAQMLEQKRAQREQARAVEAPVAAPPPPAPVASVAPPPPPVPVAAADASSRVIFMRVSKQSGGIDAALFDATEAGEPKYIGTVGSASKLAYSLKPGLYTFMVVGETADFMQATVVGGKTYYALIIPRSGARRFGVEPVRQHEIGGKEFQGWDRGTKMSAAAAQPYKGGEVAGKRSQYWQEWMRKSDAQRAELTLNAEDGR